MKSRIIDEAIVSLRQEGLRFSVDTLAERMKVSKKTIYKYFPTKEALAYAMYERYYDGLRDKIARTVGTMEQGKDEKLLEYYFDSAKMIRGEIFNKYCLNKVIGDFSLQRHTEVWNVIKPYVCAEMSDEDAQIYKVVVDGAFEKAIGCNADSVKVIEMLRRIK